MILKFLDLILSKTIHLHCHFIFKLFMYSTIFQIHKVSVLVFLLIYLIKTIALLLNKEAFLTKFTKITKIPEMVVSASFLITGVYMIISYPINTFLIIKLVAVFASIPLAIIGFKKKNKVLAATSLVLIIAAYGLAEMNKKRFNKALKTISKTETTANPLALGKTIYTQGCVACHGESGNAGLAGAANLKISTLSHEEIIYVLKNGRNSMPKFNTLSEVELEATASYIETLK
jgi:mono/diheme cytochrome c family protein